MPQYFKVDANRPMTLVGAERVATVTNGASSGTLYVGNPTVSAASNDYSIAAGASRVVKGPAFGIASTSVPVTVNPLTVPDRPPNQITRWFVGDAPHDDAAGSGSQGGTSTTPTAGTVIVGQVNIEQRCLLTGIRYLAGGTGGTDLVVVALYDYRGTPLAYSAVAGTTCGTANVYTDLAFTTPYEVPLPGRYFAGWVANGTTCRLQVQDGTVGQAGDVSYLGGTHASGWTAGSAPTAITAPASVGALPVLSTY